ncbi:hypothetical protein [Streptacidiphilus sp. PAMC 29251]
MNTPRLCTLPDYPGMVVQLNGVEIPVAEWSIDHGGYGLNHPVSVSLRFEATFETAPEPETPEQAAERIKAEQAAALDAATAEWQAVRDQHPGASAVLNLHYPIAGYQRVDCDHCEQSDGMESTEQRPWPCATYAALAGAAETLTPLVANITVQGSVTSEGDIAEAVTRALRRGGITYKR